MKSSAGRVMNRLFGLPQFRREWNIFFRTIHILSFSILFGGHYFTVPETQLLPFFYVTIASGLGLILTSCRLDRYWPVQIAGLSVLLKLVILFLVFFYWEYRVPLYIVVIILATVGSHAGSTIRHYSVLHRRVLK